jgi:hypothetical protein
VWLALNVLASASCDVVADGDVPPIHSNRKLAGGTAVPPCQWPNVGWVSDTCTVVLAHPRLALYPAHCGTAFSLIHFDHLAAPVAVKKCEVHPDGAPGNGLDIAYCVLEEDVVGIPIVPVLAGCEATALGVGRELTIVGFGSLEDGTGLGVKRELSAPILAIGKEIQAGGDGKSICPGDSGAPAFVRLSADVSDSFDGSWRLAALASSTTSRQCDATLPARLTSLIKVLRWVEDASGIDLSPCYDSAGAWAPSPSCADFPSTATPVTVPGSSCPATQLGSWSHTCGPPFDQTSTDLTAPRVWYEDPVEDAVLKTSELAARVTITVGADDTGWGVRAVLLEISGSDGRLLASRSDEVPPYTFLELELPHGTFQVRATAVDHAGLTATALRTLTIESDQGKRSANCAFVAGSKQCQLPALVWVVLGWLVGLWLTKRWHRCH